MSVIPALLVSGACLWSSASGGCPKKLGIAINTGDLELSMSRVRYSVGSNGWAQEGNFKSIGIEPDIVVYSSIKRGWMPWGAADTSDNVQRCVPVVPCCGGENLGSSLALAQKMREFTWKLMLEQFSSDTQWFISTEDDAWWNITRLCDVIDEFDQMPGGDDSSNPMIVSVGRFKWEEWGAFIVMNRAALELFANETLMDNCRADLLKPENDILLKWRYEGTEYNLDQLIGHCFFRFFPKVTDKRFVTQFHYPISWLGHNPDRFWYNSANGWGESRRAADLIDRMTPEQRTRYVGVHHVTIDDMAYLESRDQKALPIPAAPFCTAWANPYSAHIPDDLSTLCDVADPACT